MRSGEDAGARQRQLHIQATSEHKTGNIPCNNSPLPKKIRYIKHASCFLSVNVKSVRGGGTDAKLVKTHHMKHNQLGNPEKNTHIPLFLLEYPPMPDDQAFLPTDTERCASMESTRRGRNWHTQRQRQRATRARTHAHTERPAHTHATHTHRGKMSAEEQKGRSPTWRLTPVSACNLDGM